MSNDIFTVSTVFETKGQEEAEKALKANEEATKAYEKAQQQLSSRMKVSIDKANKKAKTLGQLDNATKRAENEIKRLAKSVQDGAITGGQFQGRLNQIAAELRKSGFADAQSRVAAYGRATLQATKEVKQFEAAQKAKQASIVPTQTRLQTLAVATRNAGTASQRAREQFLATANSIAVLDGPLGGVASRFSAFGVLIGRIGIPLAALSIGFATFTFAAQRAIREFAEFEVQLATIENRLNSFGNQFNLTTQEILNFSESLALNTLADEREVLRAANSLLTFRNITTDLFDDILTAAQDLAASGFGTIESETLRLAKALEDPRQSLTALSRAGITFTRQQRELIISLVDTGREAEAMERILANVERQVGGAGLAQANNTLAGSFDTLGQGVRTATREFADFVLQEFGVRRAIDALAARTARYIESTQELSLTAQLKQARSELDKLNDSLSTAISRESLMSTAQLARGQRVKEVIQEQISAQIQLVAALEQQVELEAALRDVGNFESQLNRRLKSLDALEAEIDLQREFIGLTQEQERVQRALAAQGLASRNVWADINSQVKAYAEALTRAGVESGMVHRLTRDLRNELQGVRDVAERYAKVFEDQRIAREINRIEESLENSNGVLRLQVQILEEARAAGNNSLTVTEARRQAELRIQKAMIQTQMETYAAAWAAAVLASEFEDTSEAAAAAADNVARMAAILVSLQEAEDLQLRVGQLGRPERGGGGGGGGRDPNADYRRELDALVSYLGRRREEMMIAQGFERELIFEQYDERIQVLQSALDRELLTEQQHADRMAELVQSREDRITQIEQAASAARLSAWSGAFGDLASLMSTENQKLFRIGQAAAIAQATVDGYAAAVSAWEKGMKIGGPPVAAAFTAMSLARTGALIAGIGGRQPGSRGGSSGSGRSAAAPREPNPPREMRELTPQRVLIQGLDPDALFTGEQLQNLFDSFYEENDNRGKVFVVNR